MIWRQLQKLRLNWNPVLSVQKEDLANTKNIKNSSPLDFFIFFFSQSASFYCFKGRCLLPLRERTCGWGGALLNLRELCRKARIGKQREGASLQTLARTPRLIEGSVNAFEHRDLSSSLGKKVKLKTGSFLRVSFLFLVSDGCVLLSRSTISVILKCDLMQLRTRRLSVLLSGNVP